MTGSGEISIEVVLSRREEHIRKFTFKAKIKDARDVSIVGSSLKGMVRLILDHHLSEEDFRKLIENSEEQSELKKLGLVR